MGMVFVVVKKDIREAFLSKSTYLFLAFLILVSLPYFDGLRSVINGLSERGNSTALLSIQAFLDGLCYNLPLVVTMFFSSFLSAYAVILEKTRRTLESLMATPLSLRQIWFGKSLAIALPGTAVTFLVLFLVLVALNVALVVPAVGGFMWPGILPLVTGLIMMPVMAFFVILIVTFLQLVMGNPRIANFAYIAIFLGIYMGTITQAMVLQNLTVAYSIAVVVLGAIVLLLVRLLKKEKVILSMKG